MRMRAETGAMLPQAKEDQEQPKAGRGQEGAPLVSQREGGSANTLKQ